MATETEESKRFRSFAERYIVERAGTFAQGEKELEDAWKCILSATSIYKMIDGAANKFRTQDPYAGMASQAQGMPGVVGNIGPAGVANAPYGIPQGMGPPNGSRAQAAARRAATKTGGHEGVSQSLKMVQKIFDSYGWTGRKP